MDVAVDMPDLWPVVKGVNLEVTFFRASTAACAS